MYERSFVHTLQYSIPLSVPVNLSVYFTAEPLDIIVSPSLKTLLVWSITFATCERISEPFPGIVFNNCCVLPKIESSLNVNLVDRVSSKIVCSFVEYSAFPSPNLFLEFELYHVKLPPIEPPSLTFLLL